MLSIASTFADHLASVASTSTVAAFLAGAQWEFQKNEFPVKERTAFMNTLGFVKGEPREKFEAVLLTFWQSVQSKPEVQPSMQAPAAEDLVLASTTCANVIRRAGIHVGQRLKSLRFAGTPIAAIQVLAVDLQRQTCSIALFRRTGGHELGVEISANELEMMIRSKAKTRCSRTVDMFLQ